MGMVNILPNVRQRWKEEFSKVYVVVAIRTRF